MNDNYNNNSNIGSNFRACTKQINNKLTFIRPTCISTTVTTGYSFLRSVLIYMLWIRLYPESVLHIKGIPLYDRYSPLLFILVLQCLVARHHEHQTKRHETITARLNKPIKFRKNLGSTFGSGSSNSRQAITQESAQTPLKKDHHYK